MGHFILEGTIDTSQFWPTGSADADTTSIKVLPTAFYYQSSSSAVRQRVGGFDGAYTVGNNGRSLVIKNDKVVVRLQGIDAPELHYRPTLTDRQYTPAQRERFREYNEDYRQVYAETAADTLGSYLKKIGESVSCVATTIVDRPVDAFDIYGRFVGDIVVRKGQQEINLNRWILCEGLAVPGIYNSMTGEEIRAVLDAYAKGLPRLRPWYAASVVRFSAKRVFRKKPANTTPDADVQNGKFFLPKLFRRQALHYALKSAKIVDTDFAAYLTTLRDEYMMLADFLQYGNDSGRSGISSLLKQRALRYGPGEIVFTESEARLFDRNGKFMSDWVLENNPSIRGHRMACAFADDTEKRVYVRRVVREGIAEADGGNPPMTQETFLGTAGLQHTARIKRKYYAAIRRRVQIRGCDLGALSADDFVGQGIAQVKDVTDLVFNNLG